jgi:hypothetical protein
MAKPPPNSGGRWLPRLAEVTGPFAGMQLNPFSVAAIGSSLSAATAVRTPAGSAVTGLCAVMGGE